jgi:surface antigen
MHARTGIVRALALLALVGGAIAVTVPSHGDPPPWAPAHGKRKKGDPYTGYSGKKWDKHYGVLNGRCNREVVGAVIGASAGGAIGSQVGSEQNRQMAILVGSVAGAIIGAQVGRGLDEIDRACIGHALELVGDKRSVTWASADNRRTFRFYPVRGFENAGVKCREFDFRVTTTGGDKKTNRVKACPGGDGTWHLLD